jgi:hypothetical protein
MLIQTVLPNRLAGGLGQEVAHSNRRPLAFLVGVLFSLGPPDVCVRGVCYIVCKRVCVRASVCVSVCVKERVKPKSIDSWIV